MIVLPQFEIQWHQYEGQPDAVMRMRVAEELRRLDEAGAPLLTCVLTIPDERVQQVALERLRENDDGEGRPIYDAREWKLRVAKDGVAPATGEIGDAPPTEAELHALIDEALPVLDWHHLWADDTEEEWIVEPIIPARRLVALYSPPKMGKSLLSLEIAAAIAAGRTVLGQEAQPPKVVLYVDFENDPKVDVRERLTAMGLTVGYMTSQQLATREQAYAQTWARIIKASGFQAP